MIKYQTCANNVAVGSFLTLQYRQPRRIIDPWAKHAKHLRVLTNSSPAQVGEAKVTHHGLRELNRSFHEA